ncbi:MAG: amidohydrolase [Roseburia sp.]|uniref:amidohydrolase n=1 Tax=Roseburia sp. 831b TaxID=1261635 RepID=UPI00095338E7|nr:amidohydrolase [Roseburia sp. 831b]MCI5920289.1 amidohydrolase [Roseburia sp.]MDD6215397.1 amidohydrolase [Roseburia sp.]MDY5882107.1 amidohydrolase [Roseburia sp.]WVK72549.1 amidohydrolase [Roseburia sp. 831b]
MEQGLLIKQGCIHNAIQEEPFVGDILVINGKIAKIAPILEGKAINDAEIFDAEGCEVYPGFVDAHCHLGLQGTAVGYEGEDFNELSDCITPQLSAIDAVNPQDETFAMARSGGVTCVATGPGSSNVVGGTFCAIKTAGKRIDHMLVKKAVGMKIAFGENPKNCYKRNGIYSRMTIAADIRELLYRTQDYQKRKLAAGFSDDVSYEKMPPYDAKLEAMLPVIEGELPLKAHVHRADDIFTAIRIAKEFGIGLCLDHVTDGSLTAKELAKEGVSLAIGPSLGHPTKYELKHKSFATPGILAKAGCQVAIITDSPVIEERFLALCAGYAIDYGMTEFQALQAITIHAAKHIGVEKRVGSIEEGKDGDFVVVKGNPFVRNPEIVRTIIEGKTVFEPRKMG